MLARNFGRSNLQVSAVGLGCWAIGGPFWRTDGVSRTPMGWGQVDDRESIRAIQRALELGATFFDTANNYGCGHSERVLGQALEGRRDQVVIATKFASVFDEESKTHFDICDLPMTLEAIQEACEASLKRLQTEYIDLYQFHDGGYPAERAGEVRDILELLVAQGKIRFYGWSTDDPERARVFAQGAHCASVQHRLHILRDASEMLALCDESNLLSINKQPLASGALTGAFTPERTFPEDDERHDMNLKEGPIAERLALFNTLRDVLTSDGRTLVQGVLGWILARSERTVPIPGFKTVRQVEENVGVLQCGPLNSEQMREVDRLLGRNTPGVG